MKRYLDPLILSICTLIMLLGMAVFAVGCCVRMLGEAIEKASMRLADRTEL